MLEVFAGAAASALSGKPTTSVILNTAITAPVVLSTFSTQHARQSDSRILRCDLTAESRDMRLGTVSSDSVSSNTSNAQCNLGICLTSASPHSSSKGGKDSRSLTAIQHASVIPAVALQSMLYPSIAARKPPSGPLAAIDGAPAGASDSDHMSGWVISPARLDASLHLGVLESGAGCRVPVALDACTIPAYPQITALSSSSFVTMHSSQVSNSSAAASRTSVRRGVGEVHRSDVFCHAEDSGCWPGVALSGLHTRTTNLSASTHAEGQAAHHTQHTRTATSTSASQLKEADFLYVVASEASTTCMAAASPLHSSSCSQPHHDLYLTLSDAQPEGLTLRSNSTAISMVATALQASQLLSASPSGSLAYRTNAVVGSDSRGARKLSSMRGISIADAAIQGLLRTAITEMPEHDINVQSCVPLSTNAVPVGVNNGGCKSVSASVSTDVTLQRSRIAMPTTDLCQIRSFERGSLSNLVVQSFSR